MSISQPSKIIKIGNSRGVRIPRKLLEQARLVDEVEITLQGDRLEIRALPNRDLARDGVMLNAEKKPVISGTTMKVIELVIEHITYGWSPEEIKYQHPYLSMGQIYASLAYYWDHKAEIEREIEEQTQAVEQFRKAAGNSPARTKLHAKGAK